MTGVSQQSGRYSMKYETTRTGSRLDVTITQLNRSDSGDYGCGLFRIDKLNPYQEFKIIVMETTNQQQSGGKFTFKG